MKTLLDSFLPHWLLYPGRFYAMYEAMLWLIPALPFFGFLINALCRKSISKSVSGVVACAASGLAFFWASLSFLAMTNPKVVDINDQSYAEPLHAVYSTWISWPGFDAAFGLYMDQLSGMMTLVVTGVGTLIHVYSMGYMAKDPGFTRYFAYLNLFLASMLVLVLGDNLIFLFVGWEGVGLCSYLLIGFWFQDSEKADAGIKAFVFNRIGDLGFLLGIFTLAVAFGTVNFRSGPDDHAMVKSYISDPPKMKVNIDGKEVKLQHPGLLDYAEGLKVLTATRNPEKANVNRPLGTIIYETNPKEGEAENERGFVDLRQTKGGAIFPTKTLFWVIALACLFLLVGATGKSAQIPLYAWLPDAMAGPTPVSALIHAATMVTAGVYMVTRLHPLFSLSEGALYAVAVVGGATAIFAALIGLTQTDIKKVLAYSTVSQLGYMFLGAGVGAYSFAMYHVVTHAFFKALLFLAAGSVIHAMSDEQDLSKMGGLRKKLPITFATMLIGSLALAGFPGTSGWQSKDAILLAVAAKANETHEPYLNVLYYLGIFGAFLTAFYTFRMICLAFFGECRASKEVQDHIHESPPIMYVPLVILAILSLFGGYIFNVPEFLKSSVADVEFDHEHVHSMNLILTTIASLAGIALAVFMYGVNKKLPVTLEKENPLHRASRMGFHIDALYMKLAAIFAFCSEVAHLLIDVLLIDFLVVNGAAALSGLAGKLLRKIQTGLVNTYALGILVGVLAVFGWLVCMVI